MMFRRLFTVSTIGSIVFSVSLGMASIEEQKPRTKGPITVTSTSLTADNKAGTALFEGSVIAKTTEMTIYADRMLVYYSENGGEVTKIDAMGNVKVLKETKVITSEKAVYLAEEDKVVFTGDPRAVDGENMVTGSKITFFINEDRSLVENSKVFLKSRKDK